MERLVVCAGAVSGVQGSLQSLFQTLAYAVGILVPQAEDFAWLMTGSCSVVAAAACLYTSFALQVASRDKGSQRTMAVPVADDTVIEMATKALVNVATLCPNCSVVTLPRSRSNV